MKYLLLLMVIFFSSSCCGTKQVVESNKQKKELAMVSEHPVSVESNYEKDTKDQEQKVDEIVGSEAEATINTGNHEQEHSLPSTHGTQQEAFTQTVTQRTLTEHQLWDELLEKHVSNDGKVDYLGFKKDHRELLGYVRILQMTYEKLNQTGNRTPHELLAFWINAYNALTVDLILRSHPLESIKDIKDPWDQRLWKFGDKWLSLNHIEHQILRKMNEPRIHFAIVCASVSCPKLQNKAFTAEGLDEQLTQATKAFLSDGSKNQLSEDSIKISKIFKWFGKDFKTKDSNLIDFLNQYSDVKISDKANKSYLDYNWDLND